MPCEKRNKEEPFGEGTIEVLERAIIHVLVDSDRQRPWSFEEIVREYSAVSDHSDVEDALEGLRRAGLVNAIGGCYVATRAAVHIFELGILSV